MFVLDMHNYVLQGLQSVNYHGYRGLDPEQIDIALNRAMNVKFNEIYIGMKGNSNFEGTRKRRSELSSLLVDYHSISPIVACNSFGDPIRVYNNDSTRPVQFRCMLPDDFAILERTRVTLFYNDCGSIVYTTQTKNMSIAIIPFITNPDVLGGSMVVGVTITAPDDTGAECNLDILSGVGNPAWSSYSFPQDAEMFIYHFIDRANYTFSSTGGMNHLSVYWEAYNGFYYPGSFLFVTELPFGITDTVKIKFAGMTYIHESSFRPDNKYKILIPANDSSGNLSGNYRYARVEERTYGDIEMMLMNAFHRPNSNKVLITEHEKHIDVYTDETSIATEVVISYIRRPKRISLSMNQGCELNPFLHENICDLAITYIKAAEGHPNYQNMVVESTKGN